MMLGLPQKDVPIIAMITRLVSHKGIELVKSVIEDVLHEDVQFVLLGTGDAAYENFFRELGNRYDGKVSANIAFNGDLSRKIYSGCDPMDYSPPSSSVHGIVQVRIQKRVAISNPGVEPASPAAPALQAESFPLSP